MARFGFTKTDLTSKPFHRMINFNSYLTHNQLFFILIPDSRRNNYAKITHYDGPQTAIQF